MTTLKYEEDLFGASGSRVDGHVYCARRGGDLRGHDIHQPSHAGVHRLRHTVQQELVWTGASRTPQRHPADATAESGRETAHPERGTCSQDGPTQ